MFEIIYQALDAVFGPLIYMDPNPNNPIFAIFIIATIVAFVITLANKLLVNQDRLHFLQQEMKGFQQEAVQAQKSGDPKRMADMQKKQMDMMGQQKEMMFMSFKPMIVTFIPIILVFYWMAQEPHLSHLVINLPTFAYYILLVPIFHMFYHLTPGTPVMSIGWLGWYILVSFAMSLVFRKYLGLKGAM